MGSKIESVDKVKVELRSSQWKTLVVEQGSMSASRTSQCFGITKPQPNSTCRRGWACRLSKETQAPRRAGSGSIAGLWQ
jgi:hypothetical protein